MVAALDAEGKEAVDQMRQRFPALARLAGREKDRRRDDGPQAVAEPFALGRPHRLVADDDQAPAEGERRQRLASVVQHAFLDDDVVAPRAERDLDHGHPHWARCRSFWSARASAIIASTTGAPRMPRSEEHTSELQSLMRNSYAV